MSSIIMIAVIGLLHLFAPNCEAQKKGKERTSWGALYLEAGGNGFIYSLNYDQMLSDHFSVRLGGETVGFASAVVIMGNLLAGSATSSTRAEIGLGRSIAFWSRESRISGWTGTLGVRYQPLDPGFFFKFAFTPIAAEEIFIPWFGLSFGATL